MLGIGPPGGRLLLGPSPLPRHGRSRFIGPKETKGMDGDRGMEVIPFSWNPNPSSLFIAKSSSNTAPSYSPLLENCACAVIRTRVIE